MLGAIRPQPFRGDVIAAGVVVLATLVLVVQMRFDDEWEAGVHFVYAALAAGLVLAMAVLSPREGDAPRPYQSVLIVSGFALTLAALISLADALGADSGTLPSGTVVWIGLLLIALAAYFAIARNSSVATLLAGVTAVAVVLAFVDWVFDPDSASTFRWLMLFLTIGFVFAALGQRDRRRRHAVQLVNTAGLTVLVLAITFLVESVLGGILSFFSGGRGFEAGVGTGWELFIVACALGLIAYAAVDRENGPAYLGVVNLLAFVVLAARADEDGASLIGWPLLFAVLAGIALWVGLRPTHPAPPEPAGPEAPTTPIRTD